MSLVHDSTPRLRGLCWLNYQQKTVQESNGKIGTAEEEHVRYRGCRQAIGNDIGKGISKIGVTLWSAHQETCFITRRGEGFTFGARRRFCGDRIEGESAGAQEAAGERVSKQSKHHRGRFDIEQESVESEESVGERQGYCVSVRPSTRRRFSLRVWGSRMETQCRPPTIDDVKDENPVLLDSETDQQVQISCGQVLVPQSRQSGRNIRRERVVPKNVRSFTTPLFQISSDTLHRHGIGKTKHIDLAHLGLQDGVESNRLGVRRVKSEDNLADIGTKAISSKIIRKHTISMGRIDAHKT